MPPTKEVVKFVKNNNCFNIRCKFDWHPSIFKSLIIPRKFYLKGDVTNLYSFIQGLLEWPFSELLSANVSLWNQCKYIAFNIFLCRIFIILYKMLIITGTSNEKTNELTIYPSRHTTSFQRWYDVVSTLKQRRVSTRMEYYVETSQYFTGKN